MKPGSRAPTAVFAIGGIGVVMNPGSRAPMLPVDDSAPRTLNGFAPRNAEYGRGPPDELPAALPAAPAAGGGVPAPEPPPAALGPPAAPVPDGVPEAPAATRWAARRRWYRFPTLASEFAPAPGGRFAGGPVGMFARA